MFFGKKIEKILKNNEAQNTISEVHNLLMSVFIKNPEKMTLCEKNIVYIFQLEDEVNNGGFHQYFFNSSGDFANETIEALKTIESKIFLNILEKAVNKFPDGIVPQNRNERQDILLKIDENIELWAELDESFFLYEEDIHKLMIEYIQKNIKDFR